MTILRAQSESFVSNSFSAASQQQRSECRGVFSQSRRQNHSLLRAASVRDVQTSELAQRHPTPRKRRRKAVSGRERKKETENKTVGKVQGQFSWLAVASIVLLPPLIGGPALAAYSPADGEQVVKNVAGAAYILLVCIFFFRLFRKRAYTGVTQSFRSKVNEAADEPEEIALTAEQKEATPLTALCLVDGYFDGQEIPSQYTAHNITVTLRTVIRGLAYLLTFLFGANALGLAGLAVQLAFFPEKEAEDVKQE